MTPTQHYFPYFFHADKLNKDLKSFGLSSFSAINSNTQMAESLSLTKLNSKDTILTIPFGTTLMVEGEKLLYWTTDYDTLDITQAQLKNLEYSSGLLNQKIDIRKFSIGLNNLKVNLDLNNFVTYLRKEDLKYEQEYYERFVIVIIKNQHLNIIPFDRFNKSGGDYGYVWPATARLDTTNCILYGQGMRMSDFTIDLNQACL